MSRRLEAVTTCKGTSRAAVLSHVELSSLHRHEFCGLGITISRYTQLLLQVTVPGFITSSRSASGVELLFRHSGLARCCRRAREGTRANAAREPDLRLSEPLTVLYSTVLSWQHYLACCPWSTNSVISGTFPLAVQRYIDTTTGSDLCVPFVLLFTKRLIA